MAPNSLAAPWYKPARFPLLLYRLPVYSVQRNFYAAMLLPAVIMLLASCSISRQISKQANKTLLEDSAASTGHIGISIYDPATGEYLYNYNATKYFVPASNTKLFSLYAGLKYLGDSLVGLRYLSAGKDSIKIFPSGDPTFLHPDFKKQRVFDFLGKQQNITYRSQLFTAGLGKGWAWDDYEYDYMIPRSEFPIYGNLIRIYTTATGIRTIPGSIQLRTREVPGSPANNTGYRVNRSWDKNEVSLTAKTSDPDTSNYYELPLVPDLNQVARFLSDTIKSAVATINVGDTIKNKDKKFIKIYSQPADSLYKPMMYRSDNFFAEQTLLMASNELLGYMNDEEMIDTLLNTDLRDIPQKPSWVDGSGLSRYNLFTPQSFIYILNKLKNEFGLERLKNILPTGGRGTLSSYYKKDAGFIFAKTGTLNNHCALSGFIITKKNRLLVFSVLVNNFHTEATPIRKAIEKFLTGIREKY